MSSPTPPPDTFVTEVPPSNQEPTPEKVPFEEVTEQAKRQKRGRTGSRVAMRIPKYGSGSGTNVPT